ILGGQAGTVSYFQDMSGITPVAVPSAFPSSGGVVWAQVIGPAPSNCPSGALAQINLTVTPPMMPTISGVPNTACSTDPPINLPTVQDGQAGSWTGAGVTGNQFNPAAAATGPNTITFTPSAAGCNIHADWVITVAVGPTPGPIVPLEICYTLAPFSATENIGAVENSLTGGSPGLSVNWFTDPGATAPLVLNPFSPATATSIGSAGFLYAQITNGTCSSITVMVPFTNEEAPTATPPPTPFEICGNPPQIFDLTTQDATILNGQSGTVSYFLDAAGNTIIPSPNIFSTSSASTTVFAQITSASPLVCPSNLVPVNLIILAPAPTPLSGVPPSICQSSPGLTLPVPQNGTVNGNWSGTGVAGNFFNPASATPGSTVTLTFTPTLGQCAAPNTIDILVEAAPTANPASLSACGTAGNATFDLTSVNNSVNGGTGNAVNWFFDIAAANPIPNPAAFNSSATTVFATVSSGGCNSAPVAVTLSIEMPPNLSPSGAPNTFCVGETVDLNTLLNNPGGASIQWFVGATSGGATSPASFPAANSGTYTALATLGNCTAEQTVNIVVSPAPSLALNGPIPVVCIGDGLDLNQILVIDQSGTGLPITWHSVNPPSAANQINPAFLNAVSGPITVFAVAGLGTACENVLPVAISPLSPPMLDATPPSAVCSGNTLNLASIVVTENGVPIGPTWHTAIPPSPANQLPTLTVTPFGPTTYFAVQNLGGPCEAFVPVPVNVVPPPDLFLADPPILCLGAILDLSTLNVIDLNGGTPIITWHTSMFPNLGNQVLNTQISPNNSINYYAVANLGGCEDILEVLVTVTPAPNLMYDDDVIICAGQNVDLGTLPITGAAGAPISFHSAFPPNPGNQLGSTVVAPAVNTTYFAFAQNQECRSTLPLEVIVQQQPDISLPMALDTCSETTILLSDLVIDNAGNDPVLAYFNGTPFGPATELANDTVLLLSDTTFYVQAGISGCIDIDSIDIQVTPQPALTVPSDTFLLCSGTDFDLVDAMVIDDNSTGTAISYFSEANNGFQEVFPGTSITINQDSIFYAIADAGNDCSDTLTLFFLVTDSPIIAQGPDTVSSCGGYLLPSIAGTNLPGTTSYFTSPMGAGNQLPAGTIIDTTIQLYIFADNGGLCIAEDSIFIDFNPVPTLSLSIGDSISCFDSTDGSIMVSVMDATGPITYDWNIDSLDGNDSPTNLGPELYELMVTDSFGCSATQASISLVAPAQMVLNCSEANPVSMVNAADGQALINIAGGTAPFTLDWMGPNMSAATETGLSNGDNTLDDLAAGNYDLTVTDANGCMSNCSFTITDPNCDLTVDPFVANVNCFETLTGLIDLNISGGTAPINVVWNEPSFGNQDSITMVEAGIYEYEITDALGCSLVGTITVLGPDAPLMLNCDSTTNATDGQADGTLSFSVSGGYEPYTYVLVQNG
ncbi:MAG: hypothetical protein AAF840_04850, partial [Bacteroidota bacterium]